MIGKVVDQTPTLVKVDRTMYIGSGKYYNVNELYNSHSLYLGAKDSRYFPSGGWVEDNSPTLYSVINE